MRARQSTEAGTPLEIDEPTEPSSEVLRASKHFTGPTNIVGGMYTFIAVVWCLVGVVGTYFIWGIQDPKERWGQSLPDLAGTPGKAISIGVHFVGGVYLTVMGVFQVSPWSRTPDRIHLHRLSGHIFTFMAVVTFVGGMGFLAQQRIMAGGLSMTISFGIYGMLVLVFTLMAWVKARQKDFESHRRWAIRAFVFGVGSITYRIMLGFCTMLGLIDSGLQGPLNGDPRLSKYYTQTWVRIVEWGFWIGPVIWTEWYLNAPPTNLQKTTLAASLVIMGLGCVAFLIDFANEGAARR